MAAAIRREVSSSVWISMSGRHGVVHEAIGAADPSMPTMQTRQAPKGAIRSSKQSVGT